MGVRKAAVLTVWNLTVAGYCLPLSEVEAGYCLQLCCWFRL